MAIARPRPARKRFSGPAWAAAFGLLILAFSLQIKSPGDATFGPRFWPILIGLLLLAVNSVLLVRELVVGPGNPEPGPAGRAQLPEGRPGVIWLPAALVLGFPVFVYVGGFLAGSAFFLLVFMWSLGYRQWLVIMTTSVLFSLFVNYFFTSIAYTPLPRGIGPFYEVSVEFSRLVSAR
jgi:hypothetical protein